MTDVLRRSHTSTNALVTYKRSAMQDLKTSTP